MNQEVHRNIPPIHLDFIWNDTVKAKGIGELPFSCIPAAYVQAVSQAMDYPFEKIPLTARDVWEAEKRNRDLREVHKPEAAN
ncbi:hypothetical protein AGMMS4952_24120 [Spirochaetia bacterium]|nr:hypothetical protein AGMMS4952_24120 [Spirochaetia bacterium]